MVRYAIDAASVAIDRSIAYERALGTHQTIDVLLLIECCPNRCFAFMNRFGLIDFRCGIVRGIDGPLRLGPVRRAIEAEVSRRSTHQEDGTFEIRTEICSFTVCLAYFTRALGIGKELMESIFHKLAVDRNMERPYQQVYAGKDSNLRALARVCNKIYQYGEPHPTDASIMVPSNESRAHFLRSGQGGGTTLSRRSITAYFGVPVRVTKASSFMRCALCIAMRLYSEDRAALHKKVISLMSELDSGRGHSTRGTYIRREAKKMAEERLSLAAAETLREGVMKETGRSVRVSKQGLLEPLLEPENDEEDDVVVKRKRKTRPSKAQRKKEMRRMMPMGSDDEGTSNEEDEDDGANESGEDEDENGVVAPFLSDEDETDVAENVRAEVDKMGPLSTVEAEMAKLHEEYLSGKKNEKSYLKGLNNCIKGLVHLEAVMRKFHYSCIRLERVAVYSAQEAAAACPESVCAIIMDACGKERTKIPYYPSRMKNIATDSDLMKCPVLGIQEAAPMSVEDASGHTGPSDFELRTHDYIVALEWTKNGGADLQASALIHFLNEKLVVPRVIVMVLDNARVNKGEPFIGWLALIMMYTNIDEIQLYFQTKGHTHTTLDASFGKAKPKDPKKMVLTPQGLKRHLDSLPRTKSYLSFALYEIAEDLRALSNSYSNRVDHFHFVLYKNKNTNEIVFKYSPSLKFAAPLTLRVRNMLEVHPSFLPMSDEERSEGIPVFRMDEAGTKEALDDLVSRTLQSPSDIPVDRRDELSDHIPNFIRKGAVGIEVNKDLAEIPTIAKADHDMSLREILDSIKKKGATPLQALIPEDGETVIEDLMRQVNCQKSSHLIDKIAYDKSHDRGKIRATAVRTILNILRPQYPDVDRDFLNLGSTYSGGKPAYGYKPVLDAIGMELNGTAAVPRVNSPAARRATSSATNSPAASPRATRAQRTPIPASPLLGTSPSIPKSGAKVTPVSGKKRTDVAGSTPSPSPFKKPRQPRSRSGTPAARDTTPDDEQAGGPSTPSTSSFGRERKPNPRYNE